MRSTLLSRRLQAFVILRFTECGPLRHWLMAVYQRASKNNSSDRLAPSWLKTIDLFLFFGSLIKPLSCKRFSASQSWPFQALIKPGSFERREIEQGQNHFIHFAFVIIHDGFM